MTAALDKVIRVGACAVGAVSERKVQPWYAGGSVSFHGTKRPVAILIRRDGMTLAFDVEGNPISLDTFQRRYPGLLERFDAEVAA